MAKEGEQADQLHVISGVIGSAFAGERPFEWPCCAVDAEGRRGLVACACVWAQM
jgi:hypothetical protein